MNNSVVIRGVDELGRVVLPVSLRRTLNIESKDKLEISVEGETILLSKHHDCCVLCENQSDLIEYNGKLVCRNCIFNLVNTIG